MAWRNWYDQRWEGWNGGKGMHSNFEKSPPPLQWFPVLVFLSTRKIVIRARWERMAWRNWYDERWEGWSGGKGMHGVKHSWSGTAIVPRDNENNSHTESMCQRSNETFAILSASIRTFYEWIIFSALKKLMDIRWIANIGSSAWELSWLETSSPQFTEKTIAIRSMYRGIFQYRDVPVF